MKKYNLSNIMKNAWAIRRSENVTMSTALKKAWATEKNGKKVNTMRINISDRYMTTEQLKSRNGIPCIVCSDAYDRKDALKALGYGFNAMKKTWEKVIDPQHFADLCAETAIACKLTTSEMDSLLDAMGWFQQTEKGKTYNDQFTVDGLDVRYNSYCDSIGY